jgi:uncharacterized cofD-like protein
MIRSYRLRRLFAPTAGLARAVALTLAGLFCFFLGAGLSFKTWILPLLQWASDQARLIAIDLVPRDKVEQILWQAGGLFLLLGLIVTYRGVRSGISHVIETLNPGLKEGKVDVYLRRQQLAHGPRIVAIGGGTGLSTLLRGLKHHTSNITAIVTVTDDGGSSGRLIQEKGMMPPGDIRNCLVALADAEKSMTDLFQHRFKKDSGSLSGHSVGNLLIAALVDQARGDFEKAVETASAVLAIRGTVVPSTLQNVRLRARVEGGGEICGETAIVEAGRTIDRIYLDPENVHAHRTAIEAIRSADLICIGPGSVFTSIIPNLLVPEIADALREAIAPRVYICNVMTQPGESDAFAASEHVAAVVKHVEGRIIDYVMVNTGVPGEELLGKYRGSGQLIVEPDIDRIRAMGFRILSGNFMSETDVVRHDPMKVTSRLMGLVSR